MNNRQVMTALLLGYRLCNPRWGHKYIELKGDDIVNEFGVKVSFTLRNIPSGLTRIYGEDSLS